MENLPDGYKPDPPGNIEATWEKCYSPLSDLYPYPPNKSPIIPSTADRDEDWLLASRQLVVFSRFCKTYEIRHQKDDHIQFYFWTALDRSNRRFKDVNDPNARLWEFHDMRGMLACSPWWDCPIFEDLLVKPSMNKSGGYKRDENGDMVMKRRDPHFEALEEEFLERWWFKASKLPLRRFDNGDAVLPLTADYYRAMYGDKAMKWKIEEEEETSEKETNTDGGREVKEDGYEQSRGELTFPEWLQMNMG
ncbi:hypothetical protein F53441_10139 [Fusarium austroafricanum]|uniref:Uncharacterized protein n=1 Tax=Fusarium austroafricanum TaxID=2364996 RepID=A0A8H4NUT1_9HYPO|nr:hypothetical protein F53441_10139 [Fusarium austroafricanum]